MKNLFLPHRFDRYRLAGLILHHLQARYADISQTELGRITGVDQSTISRLLNLDYLKNRAKQKQAISRKGILALTRKGFRLGHKQASLLLWLFEGPAFYPWRNEEFEQLQIPIPNDQNPRELEIIQEVNVFNSNIGRTHAAAVELLRKMFVAKKSEDGWYTVGTNILHGNTAEDHIALYNKLRDMEWRAGQRMLVSKYPSILVSLRMNNASKLLRESGEPSRTNLLDMLVERQATFQLNLRKFGERAIHSVPSIRRFVSGAFRHPLPVEERRERVRGLVKHLEEYSRFQVGLIPDNKHSVEPEVEIAIKSTREAVVRGTTRELSNHPQTVVCGPSYLHWGEDSEWAVVAFYLDFEKEWVKLDKEGHTKKEKVLQTINKLLHDAERSSVKKHALRH